jgi:hypothetical protein
MGFKQWWLANQQDERERFYVGRAAMLAYSATTVACVAVSWVELANGRVDSAMMAAAPASLGLTVFFGGLHYWKVTR